VEKEKRVLRDEEIAALGSRQHQLSVAEFERLRRMKLEADFDRRLEEESNRGDRRRDEDDTEVSPAGRAALVRRMQEDMTQRKDAQQRRDAEKRGQNEQEHRDWQQLRLDEFDFKILEDKQKDIWKQERDALAKVETDQPYRGTNTSRPNYPPPPPERKSSYEGYRPGGSSSNASQDSGGPWGGSRNGMNTSSSANQLDSSLSKKSVSFNASAAIPPPVQPHQSGYSVQGRQQTGYPYAEKSTNFRNPNFGRSPTEMRPFDIVFTTPDGGERSYDRQNSTSAPNTPGVVGRQEFYLDPRDKEATNNRMFRDHTVPERMSFRDKMIHFASEAGDDEPGEKVKNSRAQRELEVDLNGR